MLGGSARRGWAGRVCSGDVPFLYAFALAGWEEDALPRYASGCSAPTRRDASRHVAGVGRRVPERLEVPPEKPGKNGAWLA